MAAVFCTLTTLELYQARDIRTDVCFFIFAVYEVEDVLRFLFIMDHSSSYMCTSDTSNTRPHQYAVQRSFQHTALSSSTNPTSPSGLSDIPSFSSLSSSLLFSPFCSPASYIFFLTTRFFKSSFVTWLETKPLKVLICSIVVLKKSFFYFLF